MAVEGRVREGLPLVLAEEPRVAEDNVINLVPGTFAVEPVPFFLRLLPFSDRQTRKYYFTLRSAGNDSSRLLQLTVLWKCAAGG